MNRRPPPGSPEWHRQFEEDRASLERFRRWWLPLCMVASLAGAVAVIVLICLGKIPAWVLLIF